MKGCLCLFIWRFVAFWAASLSTVWKQTEPNGKRINLSVIQICSEDSDKHVLLITFHFKLFFPPKKYSIDFIKLMCEESWGTSHVCSAFQNYWHPSPLLKKWMGKVHVDGSTQKQVASARRFWAFSTRCWEEWEERRRMLNRNLSEEPLALKDVASHRVDVQRSVCVLGFWGGHVTEGPVWRHSEKSGQRRPGGKKLAGLHVRSHKLWKDLHVFRFVLHMLQSSHVSHHMLQSSHVTRTLQKCITALPLTLETPSDNIT